MLKGRTAVITGSTSGIGLAIAEALAGAGCTVVLNGLGEATAIEAVRKNIESTFKIKAGYHPADMSKPEEIAQMIAYTAREFGGVDILVNNAGIQHTAAVDEFPESKWDAIMAINLSSNFHAIKAALPEMKKKNWGRIINVASVHGLVGSVNKAAYVAAKHGVVGLTKVVALETAETGITCNAICPGWVRTALVEAQITALAQNNQTTVEQSAIDLLSEKQPSKRFVEPSEIGQLCVFLASDAARNITGLSMPIDGGWVSR
jgi:3-hydroxybutyrate dehydrogenase